MRANALHERNHGGEDHPVPCRTRQLSSPSPKVLRCSPWEDRPFRSCRAFPFSRGPEGPFPVSRAGLRCWLAGQYPRPWVWPALARSALPGCMMPCLWHYIALLIFGVTPVNIALFFLAVNLFSCLVLSNVFMGTCSAFWLIERANFSISQKWHFSLCVPLCMTAAKDPIKYLRTI